MVQSGTRSRLSSPVQACQWSVLAVGMIEPGELGTLLAGRADAVGVESAEPAEVQALTASRVARPAVSAAAAARRPQTGRRLTGRPRTGRPPTGRPARGELDILTSCRMFRRD